MRTSKEQREFVFDRARKAIDAACDQKLSALIKVKDPVFDQATKYLERQLAKQKALEAKITKLREEVKVELGFILDIEEKDWKQFNFYYGEERALKHYLEVYTERRNAKLKEQVGYKKAYEQFEAFRLQVVLSDAEGLQQTLANFIASLQV